MLDGAERLSLEDKPEIAVSKHEAASYLTGTPYPFITNVIQ